MGKMVSVIVLAYKSNTNMLMMALRSVITQSYSNIELIVQDDGSPDFDCDEIQSKISDLSPIFPVIVHRNKKNLGTVRSYNAAWKMSHGEIIVPLAADDKFFDCDVVSKIAARFEDTKCNICTSFRVGEKSHIVLPLHKEIEQYKNSDWEQRLARLMFLNFISGSVLYFRRSYLEKTGGFDEDFFLLEDYPSVFKAIISNEEIYFLDFPTIVYGENGISNGSMSYAFRQDHLVMYKKFIQPSLCLVNDKTQKKMILFHCDVLFRLEGKTKKIFRALKNPFIALRVLNFHIEHKRTEKTQIGIF